MPGQYPSGGPLPEVMDVWKAAGNAIDIYSPDIYAPNFAEWCDRYRRADNPLFIPETRAGAKGRANIFYAVGERETMGFSPFGIDSFLDGGYNVSGRKPRFRLERYTPKPKPPENLTRNGGKGRSQRNHR